MFLNSLIIIFLPFSFENNNKMKEQSQQSNADSNSQASERNKDLLTNDTDAKKMVKKKKTNSGLIANLKDTQYSVVKKVVKGMLGMKIIREVQSQDWDLYWTDNAVTSEQVGKLKPYQKINHFPGMYSLSRKNYLARNLIKMEKQFPKDYNFFPKTWVLPSQLGQLRNYMENQPNAIVIAKPQASSQGRGIFLTKSFEDFQFGEHYVVQKYLKKPFLIDGLKFDLRVYVLVAGCDPLRLYIYKQGLARFATEAYCPPKKQNLSNLFMHLTNYAINKNNEKFEFNNSATQMNKGHKRSLTSILKTLKQLGHNSEKVWNQIKQCIAKTVISAQPLLAHQYKSSQSNNYANNMCFQILGFDVILDNNLKPQILQVNYTPSFTTDTPLDLEIKKNLIHDSIVLMNITSKAKKKIINEKKKQMKQRTLTGKNFHSRQRRAALIQKAQLSRNLWQSKHMGNFQRILPIFAELPKKSQKLQTDKCSQTDQLSDSQNKNDKQQIFLRSQEKYKENKQQPKIQRDKQQVQLQQKYLKFLEFSYECYQANTGANVRRNNKILPQSNSVGQGLSVIGQQNNSNSNQANLQTFSVSNTKQTIYNQPVKYTNTQHLQKIYKSKFRPMIYKKNTKNMTKKIKQEDDEQQKQLKTPSLLKQHRQEDKEQNSKKAKKVSPYVSVQPVCNILHLKNKISSSDNFINTNEQEKHQINSKNLSYIPREHILRNQGKNRAGSSLKKGLSTVYNVPFSKKN